MALHVGDQGTSECRLADHEAANVVDTHARTNQARSAVKTVSAA
jgi:hypothetical protein